MHASTALTILPVTVTGWAAGVSVFGEDETAGMSTLLRQLFENGASAVTAVRVAEEATIDRVVELAECEGAKCV